MRLDDGVTAVVSGGANGIGRSVLLELHERGVTPIVIDNDAEAVDRLLSDVPDVQCHLCDVSDAEGVAAVAATVGSERYRVHLVVNCAGLSVAGRFLDLSDADVARAIDVNFWGLVHVTRCFVPLLQRSAAEDGATLCNVLSLFSRITLPGKSAYSASKHAAHAFSQTLYAELRDLQINVVSVYPGAVSTDFVRRGHAASARLQQREAGFLDRHGMSVEFAARRIVRAIERDRRSVWVGRDARVLELASRLTPRVFRFATERVRQWVPFSVEN